MPRFSKKVAPACLLSTLCWGCTSNTASDRPALGRDAATELSYATPASLRLVADTWPAGGPFDRAYWQIKLQCLPHQAYRQRQPIWEVTLNPYHDAGPVTDEAPWGGPPSGNYAAEIRIAEEGIAIYLPWTQESLLLSRRGGVHMRVPGRGAFDSAEGVAARLAVQFKPKESSSTHAQFTSGAGLITGVPGNLSGAATSRPSTRP